MNTQCTVCSNNPISNNSIISAFRSSHFFKSAYTCIAAPLHYYGVKAVLVKCMLQNEEAQKNILGLHLPTDPRWTDLAALRLEDILTDHAYCEQKAATSCISLIQKNADKETLVNELAPVVTEEWGHFRLVLQELRRRGLPLGRQRKDEYVTKLLLFQTKGDSAEKRLLDQLLMMALIEARSCERFKRLSEGLNDAYLRNFYRRFMESEAGHYALFIQLAEQYTDKENVRSRWAKWLRYEAQIMGELEVRGDRMH